MDTGTAVPPLASLPVALEKARSLPASGNVLSVYLSTDPQRVTGAGHRIAFRTAAQEARARLISQSEASVVAFDHAVDAVDKVLDQLASLGDPALGFFAHHGGQVLITPLPIQVADQVTWSPRAAIAPLEEALDECERVVVCLVDKERARILSLVLGEITERVRIFSEVPGKQKTGDWFALAEARYARHHEDHVVRHMKKAVRELSRELQERPFDRLIIGGPDEALQLLRGHLSTPLRARVAGTIRVPLFASDEEVLDAALVVAGEAERREEAAQVAALVDDATTDHVALGVVQTLSALNAGRMHVLVVAGDLERAAAICNACGRIAVTAGICPTCGAALEEAPDLRELAVRAAVAQGARIEIVHAAAADRLNHHGGLGGWTRY